MIERPRSATLYIWKNNKPFNIDFLGFLAGGICEPSDENLASHKLGNPMYCTVDFRMYPATKEQDAEAKKKFSESPFPEYEDKWRWPRFKTPLLEERLSKYGLPVPDVEISFCARNPYGPEGLDAKKLRAIAVELSVNEGLDVLCVPGTFIEEGQYLASQPIAQKLGIPMVPE